MAENQATKPSSGRASGHRIDEHFQQLLMTGERTAMPTFSNSPLALPEPVFPQYPDKLGEVEVLT